MPSGNQNQGQGRKSEGSDRNNGGIQQPVARVSDAVKQGAETLSNRVSEGYSTARDQVADRYNQAGEVVSKNPGSSVLIGLGIGFGLGLVLSSMVGRREETWAERYLPESLLDLPGQFNKSRIGRSLRQAPDQIHGSYDQIAETLRDLPAAIARAIPKH